jgi:hypothetical protein
MFLPPSHHGMSPKRSLRGSSMGVFYAVYHVNNTSRIFCSFFTLCAWQTPNSSVYEPYQNLLYPHHGAGTEKGVPVYLYIFLWTSERGVCKKTKRAGGLCNVYCLLCLFFLHGVCTEFFIKICTPCTRRATACVCHEPKENFL